MSTSVQDVKAAVRIADVLAACGVDPGSRKRMPCPVHGGDNLQSFAFKEDRFLCFSCGARGDVLELAQRLLKVGFRDALEFCAELGGVPRRVSRSAFCRAAREREHQRRADRARELDRWARWKQAADEHFEALETVDFLEEMFWARSESADPIIERAGDDLWWAHVRQLRAEQELIDLETEWRDAQRKAPSRLSRFEEAVAGGLV